MASSRVTELSSLINKQAEIQESISQQLININALLAVATEDQCFLGYPKWITHHYLCSIELLAGLVLTTSEENLDFLLGLKKRFFH